MTTEEPVNKNPMKPGQAKRGAKPRDPAGLPRLKRTLYLTEPEYAEVTEWIEKRRDEDGAR